jgi:catechol 2,3-dioxygenase-like lactoylglutathione lyase family enzyme
MFSISDRLFAPGCEHILFVLEEHMTIPTLKRVDHIGFTVPSADEAVAFFEKHFGFHVACQHGPFASDDDWMSVHLNVKPHDVINKIVMMEAGNLLLEIFEYAASESQKKTGPVNCDVGGHHVAFYVDDIDQAVAYLRAEGLNVLGKPTVMEKGPTAGETWVYFLAPWGMQLELVSSPHGKAYERERDALRRASAQVPPQPSAI